MTLPGTKTQIPVPTQVIRLCETFRDNGHAVVVVGGGVRDHFLERTGSGDWDLATSAPFGAIKKLRPGARTENDSHTDLSLALLDEGGVRMEITPFRESHNFERETRSDWSEPPGTLEQDLAGRDFTLNAMAYDPIDQLLYDPHGGLDDLDKTVLRALPDAIARFEYDPVRILRAVRIAGAFHLTFDPDTFAAMSVVALTQPKLAAGRSYGELNKILLGPRPSWCMHHLLDLQLLPALVPAVNILVDITDEASASKRSLWETTLRVLDQVSLEQDLFGDAGEHSWGAIIGGCAEALRIRHARKRTGATLRSIDPPNAEELHVEAESFRQVLERIFGNTSNWGRDPLLPELSRVAGEAVRWPQNPQDWERWKSLASVIGRARVSDCARLAGAWDAARNNDS